MTKLKYLTLVFIAALAVTACNPSQPQTETNTDTELNSGQLVPNDDPTATDGAQDMVVTDENSGSYTLDQIAQHATADDCWFAIEGKVYDVTSYIADGLHPGEEAILLGCGKDATDLFNKRPGDGEAHSDKARNFLPNFEIGTLAQ